MTTPKRILVVDDQFEVRTVLKVMLESLGHEVELASDGFEALAKLIFDIETVGYEFDTLTESQQEFIQRYAEKETDEEKKEKMKDESIRFLSLYPLTAKVVAIGMLNSETEHSMVLYEGSETEEWESEERDVKYCSYSESEMLQHFWQYAKKADTVVTFNGRNFDIPFIMMRSAILKIKPTKNFVKNRYDSKSHIDLLGKNDLSWNYEEI